MTKEELKLCAERMIFSADMVATIFGTPMQSDMITDSTEIAKAYLATQAVNSQLLAALMRAVLLYGQPGGPWNVPSGPGSWIAEAKAAIAAAEEQP